MLSAKLKWIIGGVLVVCFSIVVFAFVRHYNGLIAEVGILKVNNSKLEVGLEKQKEAIASQTDAIEEWKESHEELAAQMQTLQRVAYTARAVTRRLNATFSKNNLQKLSKKKPDWVEAAINRGTADILRQLRDASDSADRDKDSPGGDPEAPAEGGATSTGSD